MSVLTTRQDARERMRRVFEGALDQMIPPDESVPLKGSRLTDFEDQVEALGRQVLPVALEEHAALEGNAEVSHPGSRFSISSSCESDPPCARMIGASTQRRSSLTVRMASLTAVFGSSASIAS